MHAPTWLKDAWAVLAFFIIPVGGGIPGGVLVAKARGIAWPITVLLYFISDCMLACVFEPLMRGLLSYGRRWPRFTEFARAYKQTMLARAAEWGVSPGPFTLILVSFGIDPMTGRAAAHAAGHGFIAGWLIAIAGDMIFFSVLMVSTLWLNSVLGDGTWTAVIILICMFTVPVIVRRIRRHRMAKSAVPK